MLPESFKTRIKSQHYIDPGALLKALDEPSPVSIRVNLSKWNNSPLRAEPVPWCRTGFYLDARPSFTLDPLFHSGCYYPQEASGMFLEEAIKQTADSLENIRVLDLCGAPGGKSTHLADLIGPDGLLVANEVIRSRAVILAETITKWGMGNTLVTQSDPSVFGSMGGYFDIIAVDAPCSGEGMFRNKIAAAEWSVENTVHCSERQKRILMNTWPALRENGILIYSTCTFNPGENEENIRWLIGKKEAECIRINISGFHGITEIDYDGIYGYGFHPGRVRGEGFFISLLRKKSKQEAVKIRSDRISELKAGETDVSISEKWTCFPKDRLIRWRDEVFAVPCKMIDYLYLFKNLRIVKPGTKIFINKNNDYLPTHEQALSDFSRTGAFMRTEVSYEDAISYLRRDSLSVNTSLKGWIILTYKGVNLGFVKNIGSRVNNYFPVEWRIRMEKPLPGKEDIISWT
jgi:16S rRNA C967 or C1407 C5-methylase (RsmB/RsmF family)/NOL1/NOP2/fmu family ribosome biogenesis protein